MTGVDKLKLYINYRKTDWTEEEEGLLVMLLEFAADKILSTRYPFGYEEGTEVPSQYRTLQIRIAAELFSRVGAFGETEHMENGIYRYWTDDDVAKAMLQEVVPCVGVF